MQAKKKGTKKLMFIIIYTVVEAKKRGKKEKETPNEQNICNIRARILISFFFNVCVHVHHHI